VLRTAADWQRDIRPVVLGADGAVAEFRLPPGAAPGTGKPCLRAGRELIWASGYDVPLSGAPAGQDLYPHFDAPGHGTVSERLAAPSALAVGPHAVRIYLPPDYGADPGRRYPTLYMQDGANLFFPEESFSGRAWDVRQSMDLLGALGLIQPAIVVGVYPAQRTAEYMAPGYARFGRSLVEELKPAVDAAYRTVPGPAASSVMGSSLGGLVSFYLAWHWPAVFGAAACLSPTFGWGNDLLSRVAREPHRPLRFYLDTGGPGDNYRGALAMRDALQHRGYRPGTDVCYHAVPGAAHNESAWAARLHLPLQFLLGAGCPTLP